MNNHGIINKVQSVIINWHNEEWKRMCDSTIMSVTHQCDSFYSRKCNKWVHIVKLQHRLPETPNEGLITVLFRSLTHRPDIIYFFLFHYSTNHLRLLWGARSCHSQMSAFPRLYPVRTHHSGSGQALVPPWWTSYTTRLWMHLYSSQSRTTWRISFFHFD